MLKLKRLSLSKYVHSLLLFSILQFVVLKENTAQRIPVTASYASLSSNLRLEDTIDASASISRLPIEVLDTTEMVAAPVIGLNPKGKQFISDYLRRNEEDLLSIKKRSASYFKTIESIFRKNELPVELKYLAVIESELKTSAVSRVGAAGMWQFMPQTARDLGLKVSTKYDERKHFVKSTTAAAKYIKVLHSQFDDWLLVIAAYNSGAGTVYKAIKKAGSRDFWTLQQFLPAETRAHVKRYIGAHYYFEKEGSSTTLTKAESIKYYKALVDHNESMKVIKEIQQGPTVMDEVLMKANVADIKMNKGN